jgi:hypothetical protein
VERLRKVGGTQRRSLSVIEPNMKQGVVVASSRNPKKKTNVVVGFEPSTSKARKAAMSAKKNRAPAEAPKARRVAESGSKELKEEGESEATGTVADGEVKKRIVMWQVEGRDRE